jgi:PAS domain S-box-containing protein
VENSRELLTPEDLRREAEERLKPEPVPRDDEYREDTSGLIHELRVHQVELEMQNEELRKAQIQLEVSRTRYADLYDFSPVGYFTFNGRGFILEGNLTGAAQLGIERSRLVNTTFRSFVFQPDREIFDSHLRAVFKTPERQTCEVRLTAKNGDRFYARLESIYIGAADGEGVCRTSVSDITVSKQAEEVLRGAHSELERRVEERTAELARSNELLRLEVIERRCAEENLKVYTAKLERSNSELQDFAFIASHDMQEPLRKIQSFGSRISQKHAASLDDTGRDCLDRMMNAAKRMAEMIEGLLSYSRLGTREMPFVRVDLNRLVNEVVSDLEIPISMTGASVEVADLPVLEIDSSQISQLFQNLIANSLKFRGEEKPVVKIYARPDGEEHERGSSSAGQTYHIFVEDNGIGFEEKYLDRIFTMFQRLHGRGVYDGMVMGLAICRKVVERHGGAITATSTPGKGSTFVVTLPVTQRQRETRAMPFV